MPLPTDIRAAVVQNRIARHRTSWERMMACLHRRDDLHTALNREFGYTETDGSFSNGKKSYHDERYVAEYDRIEREFKLEYEGYSSADQQIDRAALTVYEFLLFDNASADAIDAIATLANTNPLAAPLEYLRTRAFAEAERWRRENYNLTEMLRHEDRNFGYQAARCRKFLGMKSFLPMYSRATSGFKKDFLAALESALSDDRQSVSAYKETSRAERADNARWVIALAIWSAGAYVIYRIWLWTASLSGFLGELAQFALYVVAFFYIIALMPIRAWVSRFLADKGT